MADNLRFLCDILALTRKTALLKLRAPLASVIEAALPGIPDGISSSQSASCPWKSAAGHFSTLVTHSTYLPCWWSACAAHSQPKDCVAPQLPGDSPLVDSFGITRRRTTPLRTVLNGRRQSGSQHQQLGSMRLSGSQAHRISNSQRHRGCATVCCSLLQFTLASSSAAPARLEASSIPSACEQV